MELYVLLALVSVLFVLGMKLGGKYALPDSGDSYGTEPPPWLLWLTLTIMLGLRLLLAASLEGYACDVQTFQAWAMRAADDLCGFYSGGFFADYPPGYMYLLFLVGKLKEFLLLPDRSTAFLALIKLPAILADLATVVLVYRLACRHNGKRAASALALMYGFNPAVILDSSVWGQVDAVFTFFIVLAVVRLSNGRLISSVSLFGVALLIKPQALIFTPLLLVVAIGLLLQPQAKAWKSIGPPMAAGIMVFLVGIAPFAFREGPLWIFKHYGATLTSYPYATVNAFNLFALSGANFRSETAPWLFLTFRNWGTFSIVIATLFSLVIYFYGPVQARLYLMGLFLIAAVFIFSARMHERYLFPVLIFALLAALYTGSRQILFIFAGFTITQLLNVGHVLIASTNDVFHIPSFDPLLLVTSAANLVLFMVLVRAILGVWRKPKQQPSLE